MFMFFTIVAVTLSISFMCSLLEACLLSLSLSDIARLSEKKPMVAKIWKNFRENIQAPITVILVINTLANTVGASLSGAKFQELFGPKWVALYSLLFSFMVIQWSEILPKTWGVKYNKNVAQMVAVPLRHLVVAFTPFVKLIQFLNRPFQGKTGRRVADATDEITVLAHFAAIQNMISKDQEKILARTVTLSSMKVRDMMVERNEMKYLSTNMNLMEALIEAHIHHHTRLPLVNGNDIDDVIGYVNFKDIVSTLQINPVDPSLKGICRPMLEVKETEPVSLLLTRLIKGCQHIALVKDDKSKVVGLVTLEDVIETIVGDIQDEYDILPTYFYQITGYRYLAGGGIHLNTLRDKTGLDLPVEDKTLNDWLTGLFGRTPKAEDKVSYGGMAFIVRKLRRSSIYEAIIEVPPPRDASAA